MFIVIGAVELLYIGMEFVPSLITWINLARVNKLKKKVKVYDVEMSEDKEKTSEDKKAQDKKTDDKKEDAYIEEDDLAPFEIKDAKRNKAASKKGAKINKKK